MMDGYIKLAELTRKISYKQKAAWEEVLNLYIRPKPKNMKQENWEKLIKKVLFQTEKRVFPECSHSIEEEFI